MNIFSKKSELLTQLEQVLPSGMQVPAEIKKLYQYIEKNALYIDANGYRYGMLYPENQLKASITDSGRDGGTKITFYAGGTENLKYWFGGEDNPEITSRLCVFAQSGGDGSECAFWLTDDNELKIVHMGSGCGSTLCCVLADNALDFIRLIAIGYDEICWDEDFSYPPNERPGVDVFVKPNVEFQEWVQQTFSTGIPRTALEIVKHPASMDDDTSEDAFFQWVQKHLS